MASLPLHVFENLIERGLIQSEPPPCALAVKSTTKAISYFRYRAFNRKGMPVLITLGDHLAHLFATQEAFARACPSLISGPFFHLKIDSLEVLIEPFIEGVTLNETLGSAPQHGQSLPEVVSVIKAALESTRQPSTQKARENEWHQWTERILSKHPWSSRELELLRLTILPAVADSIFATPPSLQWTHGDLHGENIILRESLPPALIDLEFSRQTHFHVVDWIRLGVLNNLDHASLPLNLTLTSRKAWQLFFWLEQIVREFANHTEEYLAQWTPHRLGTIRNLAEEILGKHLDNCPWPCNPSIASDALPRPFAYVIEDARWVSGEAGCALKISGWCHDENSTAFLKVTADNNGRLAGQSSLVERLDVQRHFHNDPRALLSGFALFLPAGTQSEDTITLLAHTADGAAIPFFRFVAGDLPQRGPIIANYPAWSRVMDPDSVQLGLRNSGLNFSLILPVYNTPESFLRECIESVKNQFNPHWEMLLVDDGSSAPHIDRLLKEIAAGEPRIRLLPRTTNGGISRASNDALNSASGDFVVMLDHDDLLRPHALSVISEYIERNAGIDVLYSDEEKITAEGERAIPFLKPAFSPLFLLGVMYPGHVLCVRTTLARSIGGFDPRYDGIQDYEFFLRLTETTRKILHIPRILYQWRQSPSSSALHGNVKGNMDELQAVAVCAHLTRRSQVHTVIPSGGHRLQINHKEAERNTRTLVVLAGEDKASSAEFWSQLQDEDFDEIAVLERQFTQLPAMRFPVVKIPETTGTQPTLKTILALTQGTTLVILNDIPLAAAKGWVQEMSALANQHDSGFVSPLLISKEGKVLESGWIIGQENVRPCMRGFDPSGDGYNGSLLCAREVSATSARCYAISRKTLISVISEETSDNLTLNHLLLCIALRSAGRFNRITPARPVTLDISWKTREDIDYSASLAWPERVRNTLNFPDPFYNSHFEAKTADYSLAIPPQHLPAASELKWHLDSQIPEQAPKGILKLRGWCFKFGQAPLTLILFVNGERRISAVCNQPRPDVAESFSHFISDQCGFSLNLRLSPGLHQIRCDVQFTDQSIHTLKSFKITVPWFADWTFLSKSSAEELIAFQMPAAPTRSPRPLCAELFPRNPNPDSPHPALCVVTPSYQQAVYLEETIRSVLDQPLGSPCSYIVQDGGSTDGSADLIQRYAARLAHSESRADEGQADAIAKGFDKTSGAPEDLMAWINSDDFYLPGALAYVVQYFAAHPNVDVLYGHRVLVDEKSREVGRWFLPPHDDEVLRLNDFVPQETVFWRRRIWDKVGGIDPTFKFAMDWDLLLRFQAAGAKIVRVPYFLACFRVHAAQKTSAQISTVGQREIDALRTRTYGRMVNPLELLESRLLNRYLKKSAWIEFLWRALGIRVR